jgi:hypothetical protein
MSMRGSCSCNNISVLWKNIDFSLVPRGCACDYCSVKGAAYVSKSGTAVEIEIRKSHLHIVKEQGSRQAGFHECANCGDVVFVTVTVEGSLYCALNANCLENRERFPGAVSVNFSDQEPIEKLERWRLNWCHPVLITSQGCKAPLARDAVTGAPA